MVSRRSEQSTLDFGQKTTISSLHLARPNAAIYPKKPKCEHEKSIHLLVCSCSTGYVENGSGDGEKRIHRYSHPLLKLMRIFASPSFGLSYLAWQLSCAEQQRTHRYDMNITGWSFASAISFARIELAKQAGSPANTSKRKYPYILLYAINGVERARNSRLCHTEYGAHRATFG